MADINQMIEALETSYKHSNVDTDNTLVSQDLVLRLITLLKERLPRLMTLEEVDEYDKALYLEDRSMGIVRVYFWVCTTDTGAERFVDFDADTEDYSPSKYGSTWRCWSDKPTEEQRKAAKWDD